MRFSSLVIIALALVLTAEARRAPKPSTEDPPETTHYAHTATVRKANPNPPTEPPPSPLKAEGEEPDTKPEPRKPTTHTFSPEVPSLSAEESGSTLLPKHMQCDACKGVMHCIKTELDTLKSQGKVYTPKKGTHKGQARIKESEYLIAMDTVCNGYQKSDDHPLKNFGVKTIDGVNVLSGPGTKAGNTQGMQIGGLQWIRKVSEFCGTMVGEVGEDEIYEVYENISTTLTQEFCSEYCARHSEL